MNTKTINTAFEQELQKNSIKLHIVMVWAAVIIVPGFSLLDYYLAPTYWGELLILRCLVAALCFISYLLYKKYNLTSEFVAYTCCLSVFLFVDFLCMRVPQNTAFLFHINSASAILGYSILVLWHWKHYIITIFISLVAYLIFFFIFRSSSLSFIDTTVNGGAVYWIVGVLSIFLVVFRYNSFKNEFKLRYELSISNEEIKEKNMELVKAYLDLHKNMVLIEEQRGLLEQKATELETSNLVKTRLFSIIGHDLRSPINSLRTLLNFIKTGHITQTEFEALLPTIQQSVSGIHVTLENLLQWSITQLHGITPTFKTLYVHKLVEENISLFGVIARDKQIELVNQVEEHVTCLADENHLRLIFRNLLSNAIKFTHSGGKVIITNTTRDKLLCINIIDNGVGIASEKLENLFDNTRWVSQYGTKGEKGIGLGLQLCKEIIELNSGYFEIKSELAKGSTFTLCLPYE